MFKQRKRRFPKCMIACSGMHVERVWLDLSITHIVNRKKFPTLKIIDPQKALFVLSKKASKMLFPLVVLYFFYPPQVVFKSCTSSRVFWFVLFCLRFSKFSFCSQFLLCSVESVKCSCIVADFPLGPAEDIFTTMPVEINQWRATIGCFRASIQ